MNEGLVKQAVSDYLQVQQNLGVLVFNRLNSGDIIAVYGNRRARVRLCQDGTPDFIVHINGETVYFECKSDKGVLSDTQVAFHKLLEAQGIPVVTVRDVEEVIKVISELG